MHIPVLLKEVIAGLDPQENENFIDGTLGDGGHSKAILEKTSPNGKVLAFDLDERSIAAAKKNLESFADRFIPVHSSYTNMQTVVEEKAFGPVNGVLLDLGFSSRQIDDPKRGFSFQHDAPLDMRFDTSSDEETAADFLRNASQGAVERVLKEYGEERYAKKIARAIKERPRDNPIKTTFELRDLIVDIYPKKYSKIHPATRTFQALRIQVNKELENVKEGLRQAVEVLAPGGRLAVISFHSLEDRIVKQYFKDQASDCICPKDFPQCVCDKESILQIKNRKVITATQEEIEENPRARSAKLRVAIKQK